MEAISVFLLRFSQIGVVQKKRYYLFVRRSIAILFITLYSWQMNEPKKKTKKCLGA
jgi:hypothetical protein